jgi:hypothetical protein
MIYGFLLAKSWCISCKPCPCPNQLSSTLTFIQIILKEKGEFFLLHSITSHLLMYFQWEVKLFLSHAFLLLIKVTFIQSDCILWGSVYQGKKTHIHIFGYCTKFTYFWGLYKAEFESLLHWNGLGDSRVKAFNVKVGYSGRSWPWLNVNLHEHWVHSTWKELMNV